MKSVSQKNVLVTGGAMGMGRAYVEKAVAEGAANIVVWDVNEQSMKQLKSELSNNDTNIYTYSVDVTDTDRVYACAEQVLENVGPIHLLINNAGIVVAQEFIEHEPRHIDLSMQVNSIAPMHITRAFLPSMAELDEAHIVNIASGAAYMYCPRIIVYCASKWAMFGWSQGLRVELGKTMPHIQVTTVTPGHIDTGMFEGAHSKLLPLIPTAAMVEAVWAGIKKNKALVSRPRTVGLIPLLRALLGIRAWGWLSEVSGTNDFMAGHKAKRELPLKE